MARITPTTSAVPTMSRNRMRRCSRRSAGAGEMPGARVLEPGPLQRRVTYENQLPRQPALVRQLRIAWLRRR